MTLLRERWGAACCLTLGGVVAWSCNLNPIPEDPGFSDGSENVSEDTAGPDLGPMGTVVQPSPAQPVGTTPAAGTPGVALPGEESSGQTPMPVDMAEPPPVVPAPVSEPVNPADPESPPEEPGVGGASGMAPDSGAGGASGETNFDAGPGVGDAGTVSLPADAGSDGAP